MNLGFLVLEDGFYIEGRFPFTKEAVGEVVFNTSPSGYEEIVTDPSYYNQIIVFTSPMIGNYGINKQQWESHCYQAKAIVCLELQNSKRDSQFLEELKLQGLATLTQVDTRPLTLHLRNTGTIWGALVEAKNEKEAKAKAQDLIKKNKDTQSDWVYQVSRKNIEVLNGQANNKLRVGILDFGVKQNTVREVQMRSQSVVVFPSRTEAAVIEAHNVDALVLSNGPGDPQNVEHSVEVIQKFIGKKPMLGICMGHQLLSRAYGAQTYKLKFGHRGANHPIEDKVLNTIYVASHNHGYAVDEKTLPPQCQVTMKNLNDGTVAGFTVPSQKILSVQYHPESCPGPLEGRQLFDYFFKEMVHV